MNSQIAWHATLILIGLAACSDSTPPSEPPRPVASIVVGRVSIGSERSFGGEVRARYETPVSFRIGGKVLRRLVDAGAVVKAGQPLALLDPADATLQSAAAEAQRQQAEAELRRFRDLRVRNFIGQAALDERESAFKAAQAQAGLARNAQRYATLRADAAGVISATLAEPGQVVAAGTPIVTLAQMGEKEIAISLPESIVAARHVGDVAGVHLWANQAKTYRGRIREISPAADRNTRTYASRISLLDADASVALGMTATVIFRYREAGELLVPASAIHEQNGQPAVWVIDGADTTRLRPVTIASWRDDGAIVTDGLQAGERIVASGVHKVQQGEKVIYKTVSR
jgi:membrane fusion protein, multidrug efflux system